MKSNNTDNELNPLDLGIATTAHANLPEETFCNSPTTNFARLLVEDPERAGKLPEPALKELDQLLSEQEEQMLHPGDRFGEYRILHTLSENGGISKVVLAHDFVAGQHVAIKHPKPLMLAAYGAVVKRAFRREAHALSRLNHRHIVNMHDTFEHDGVQYIVMEHLDGGVHTFLGRDPSLQKIYEFMKQAVQPLKHIHLQGMVHGDIKPTQYMVDSKGVLKLIDFGSVSHTGERIPEQMMTTPAYFPTSKAGVGARFTPAIDIYAFGKSITRILMSAIGMKNEHASELIRRADHDTCTDILKSADVPDYLSSIIDQCTNSVMQDSTFSTHRLDTMIDYAGGRILQEQPRLKRMDEYRPRNTSEYMTVSLRTSTKG